jgi:hypothetical protein
MKKKSGRKTYKKKTTAKAAARKCGGYDDSIRL